MRKHIAVVLAILTFCEYPCSALCDSGAKPLTLQERVLCGALRGLQWKETLSDADRTNIVSALASPKQSISGLALTVATVHNEKDVLLSFKGQIGSEGSFVRPVAMRVVEELKNGRQRQLYFPILSVFPPPMLMGPIVASPGAKHPGGARPASSICGAIAW